MSNEENFIDFDINIELGNCELVDFNKKEIENPTFKKIKGDCVKCSEYFVDKNEIHCSNCKVEIEYQNKDLSVIEILKLPTCKFKGKMLEKNLEKIYEHYKEKRKSKYKFLKNINESNILLNLCKDKSFIEIYAILSGNRGFNSVMIPAKLADKLLIQSLPNNKDDYKYIHAICPFIYDIWNITSNHGILLCYYKDFGELTYCPFDHKRLFEIWDKVFSGNFYFPFDKYVKENNEDV